MRITFARLMRQISSVVQTAFQDATKAYEVNLISYNMDGIAVSCHMALFTCDLMTAVKFNTDVEIYIWE